MDTPTIDSKPELELNLISTRWAAVHDPSRFITRYGPAINKYLHALLNDPHDADEVAQEFLLKAIKNGFPKANEARGKFRYYLITAVRNAARTHLQRRRLQPTDPAEFANLASDEDANSKWLTEWRVCVVQAAWRALERHEHRTSGNLFFTALRVSQEFPGEDSVALAARISQMVGREIRPDAFRKQLSRARFRFAELLVDEVARTLEDATPEQVIDELNETDLMKYVRPYLPKS